MDNLDISLLTEEAALNLKEILVFTTESGSFGSAPSAAPRDEIWAFERVRCHLYYDQRDQGQLP
jgi:hypothetical protein